MYKYERQQCPSAEDNLRLFTDIRHEYQKFSLKIIVINYTPKIKFY